MDPKNSLTESVENPKLRSAFEGIVSKIRRNFWITFAAIFVLVVFLSLAIYNLNEAQYDLIKFENEQANGGSYEVREFGRVFVQQQEITESLITLKRGEENQNIGLSNLEKRIAELEAEIKASNMVENTVIPAIVENDETSCTLGEDAVVLPYVLMENPPIPEGALVKIYPLCGKTDNVIEWVEHFNGGKVTHRYLFENVYFNFRLSGSKVWEWEGGYSGIIIDAYLSWYDDERDASWNLTPDGVIDEIVFTEISEMSQSDLVLVKIAQDLYDKAIDQNLVYYDQSGYPDWPEPNTIFINGVPAEEGPIGNSYVLPDSGTSTLLPYSYWLKNVGVSAYGDYWPIEVRPGDIVTLTGAFPINKLSPVDLCWFIETQRPQYQLEEESHCSYSLSDDSTRAVLSRTGFKESDSLSYFIREGMFHEGEGYLEYTLQGNGNLLPPHSWKNVENLQMVLHTLPKEAWEEGTVPYGKPVSITSVVSVDTYLYKITTSIGGGDGRTLLVDYGWFGTPVLFVQEWYLGEYYEVTWSEMYRFILTEDGIQIQQAVWLDNQ